MIKIGVMGFGTVGSGVVEVIRKNYDSICKKIGNTIDIKYILDLRDFPESPERNLLTKNADDLLTDDEVKIIVEVMGGTEPAYTFTKKALLAGKHVITSNKELVARHGTELLDIAKEKGVNYLFEASVGGGIPIIRPLNQCLAANEITEVMGILNGTTNYILTQMIKEGQSFEDALKDAQEKGYAERNPEADVEGHDACRKIAILSSLVFGQYVDSSKIHTEGISKISLRDVAYADKLGKVIKLLGVGKKVDNKIFARVSPVMISKEHPLAGVEDVYNAILVKGDAVGDVMFYGKGAGKLPTASAVVADVIDATKNIDRNIGSSWVKTSEDLLLKIGDTTARYFVRINVTQKSVVTTVVNEYLGNCDFIHLDNAGASTTQMIPNEIAFVTPLKKEQELQSTLGRINDMSEVSGINSVIRVEIE